MIWGRSWAPFSFHAAVPSSTLRRTPVARLDQGRERERPSRNHREAGDQVELGQSVLLFRSDRAVSDDLEHAVARIAHGARDRRQLLAGSERAGNDLSRTGTVADESVRGEPGGTSVERLAHDPRHLGDLFACGIQVRVRPLPHHVIAERSVRDMAGDIDRVRPGVDEVEVITEAFPLSPRHADRQRSTRDVFDPLHHVDQRFMVLRTDGRKADAAVANDDSCDSVGGRRLEGVVPGDLAVVVGV